MAFKLTLDLEALERLIGQNTQIEMELRQCIVEKFTKKYLKSLVNEKLINNCKYDILEQFNKVDFKIQKELVKEIENLFNDKTEFLNIPNELRKKLNEVIDTEIRRYLNTKITEMIELKTNHIKEYINFKFAEVKNIIEEQISKLLTEDLDKQINESIKNKIDSIIKNTNVFR